MSTSITAISPKLVHSGVAARTGAYAKWIVYNQMTSVLMAYQLHCFLRPNPARPSSLRRHRAGLAPLAHLLPISPVTPPAHKRHAATKLALGVVARKAWREGVSKLTGPETLAQTAPHSWWGLRNLHRPTDPSSLPLDPPRLWGYPLLEGSATSMTRCRPNDVGGVPSDSLLPSVCTLGRAARSQSRSATACFCCFLVAFILTNFSAIQAGVGSNSTSPPMAVPRRALTRL